MFIRRSFYMAEIIINDLLSQATKRDPYTFYTHLRSTEPIVYVEGMNAWLLTTYEDALLLLKDPRFTKDNRKIAQPEQETGSAQEEMATQMRNMLMTDAPDHTRLRALVSKAFTPRMIEQLRPRIQQITDKLLDAVQEQGSMDLITNFAYPLPITVISEMLGIPATDRQKFRTWTQAIVNMQEEAQLASLEAFLNYIKTLLDEKRAHPGNDLISSLVQVEEHGDQLGEN